MSLPRASVMALALAASTLAWPARAEPGTDYGLDSERWNGLGYLLSTAEEARVKLSVEAVDLAALRPDDVVIVIDPAADFPVQDLLAFVDAGGFLIVADELGRAAPLLERLGVVRKDGAPPDHRERWEDQEGFPIVHPAGKHFLFFNVKDLVLNYPSTFVLGAEPEGDPEVTRTPVLSYEGGREHVVVEANYGAGKVLLLADPSVFLNDMLRRFYGDKQFVANVLRLYCVREPCAARLARPGTPFVGHFDPDRARLGSLPREIEAFVEEVNRVLGEVSREAAEAPWSPLWVGVVAALGLLLAARVLGRERLRVRGLVPSLSAMGSSPGVDEAQGLVAQRGDADFSQLARVLAESAVERARKADLDGRIRDNRVSDATSRDALGAAWLRIQAEAASLRDPHAPRWSAERFLRLFTDARAVTAALGGRAKPSDPRPLSGGDHRPAPSPRSPP
jgi:hypothetical protein